MAWDPDTLWGRKCNGLAFHLVGVATYLATSICYQCYFIFAMSSNRQFLFMFCVFKVLKAKFALCQYVAQNIRSFSKRSAFYALDGLVDKIGDIKVT